MISMNIYLKTPRENWLHYIYIYIYIAGILIIKSRNIKYFQISGAISLERLGTTTQPHARALVLSFYGRAVIFSTAKR